MSVAVSGAHVELDCAHGEMSARPAPNGDGQFDVVGVYVREHGGPIRDGEMPDSHPATYTGRAGATMMTLTIRVTDTNESLGPFMLVSGATGRVVKCL